MQKNESKFLFEGSQTWFFLMCSRFLQVRRVGWPLTSPLLPTTGCSTPAATWEYVSMWKQRRVGFGFHITSWQQPCFSRSSCSSLISALLSPYHLPDRSLSAGWIGLVGRRGPRSKQPFMVTFFRENQVPCRPPRAVKPHPRRKKPKYDLPVPSIQS